MRPLPPFFPCNLAVTWALSLRVPAQGVVLVTGGLGMIGSLVGSWLVKQSVSDVVLLGRSGRPGTDSAAIMDLVLGSGSNAAITMVRCDVASVDEIGALARASCGTRPIQVGEKKEAFFCVPGFNVLAF
jgi:hypothetical protein